MTIRTAMFSTVCLVAMAAGPAGSAPVGVTAAVNQDATSTPPGASVRTLTLGANLVTNERVVTDTVGLVQILLADGTAFTVGANSDLVIDRFVYDPEAGTAQVAATLAKGAFRFIGGRASKTGGATVAMPMGTIGIRGAIGEGSTGNGEIPEHFSLKFGDKATLNGQTIPPGESFFKNPDGSIGSGPTPPGWTQADNEGFEGDPNQATNPEQVAALADETLGPDGSDSPPDELTTVDPDGGEDGEDDPAFEGTTDQDTFDTTDAQRDVVSQDAEQTAEEVMEAEDREPEPEPEPVETITARVLTAGDTYQGASSGGPVADPGRRGLVGGSATTNQIVTLTRRAGASTASGPLEQDRDDRDGTLLLTIPIDDGGVYELRYGPERGGRLGDQTLSGVDYLRVTELGAFRAHLLAVEGDVTNPVYVISGPPTVNDNVFQGIDLREYSLSRDPIQDLPVPFFSADAGDFSFEGAAITPFLILETPDPGLTAPEPRFLQTWLTIEGEGPDQVSAVGVNVGAVFDDSGLRLATGARGSFRPDALSTSFVERGGPATVNAIVDGDSDFFGTNAENFVLSQELTPPDAFGGSPAFSTADFPEEFGTIHVANLEVEAPVSIARTTRSLDGFSAGLVEVNFRLDGEDSNAYVLSEAVVTPTFTIELDASRNSIGGTARIISDGSSGFGELTVAFGFDPDEVGPTRTGGHRGILVNDDLFAARNAVDANRTNATVIVPTDSGPDERTLTPVVDRSGRPQNPATYLVSGDAVRLNVSTDNPRGVLPGGAEPCECEFLEWGYWGTQTDLRDANNPDDPNERVARATVHLGTWVAGDLTDPAEMPITGTGSYEGHAVGTVLKATPDGAAQYIASGRMDMSYDFGAREGRVDISDFDDRDFSAVVGDPAQTGLPSGTFAGPAFNPDTGGPAIDGAIAGAFVNDGVEAAGGVIGNFGVNEGANWSASGIFAGEGVPDF